jgi:hypothetical protein
MTIHRPTRTIALAVLSAAALAASAGAAFAFTSLPSAAGPGLERASDASGKTLPARPDTAGAPTLPEQAGGDASDNDAGPAEAGAPTDTHGAAVSAVATGDDPTPDSNRGVDVSAVARDNHGQATAAEHRPADAGKPDGAGKPADPGKPTDPGKP